MKTEKRPLSYVSLGLGPHELSFTNLCVPVCNPATKGKGAFLDHRDSGLTLWLIVLLAAVGYEMMCASPPKPPSYKLPVRFESECMCVALSPGSGSR